MEDLYMELFKTMNQFRKLHMADMMPEQLNQGDFFTLNHIMDAEDGKITISKLASKTKVLPSAISTPRFFIRTTDPARHRPAAATSAGRFSQPKQRKTICTQLNHTPMRIV